MTIHFLCMENIIKNQVFIRGMLVGRAIHEQYTTLVICSQSQNKEHSNYQYVSFSGDLKKEVDTQYEVHDMVMVTASVRIFRTREDKLITSQNIRLHGTGVEKTRDFTKRVVAQAGIPIYGLQVKDCVRFDFSGRIMSIQKTAKSDSRISVLLQVQETNQNGYNLIPLIYNCRPGEMAEDVLEEYKKGSSVCVRGFVAQKRNEKAEKEARGPLQYINSYYITTFLRSAVDIPVSENAVVGNTEEATPIR